MDIVVEQWVNSVKRKVREQCTVRPEFRPLARRFKTRNIREAIYDYLDENMHRGVDGLYQIIIHTRDGGEATVLKLTHVDEHRLTYADSAALHNNVFYVTKLQGLYDARRLVGVQLQTFIGFKHW